MSTSESEEMRVRWQGFDAGKEGRRPTENPYKDAPKKDWWEKGRKAGATRRARVARGIL